MTSTTFTRVIQVMIGLTALVGLLDAIDAEQADLAIVFGIALVLSLILVVRSFVGRRAIGVRADLARWMADRAAVGGERIEAVADRAISAYRAGFVGHEGAEPAADAQRTVEPAEDAGRGAP